MAGFTTDAEARTFALALSRKRSRFAFPDEFNHLVKALQTRIRDKHDKTTEEGRALRALREIRVSASPTWEAPDVELFFWFVKDADSAVETRSWETTLTGWMALVTPKDRYTKVEAVAVTLGDMTAQEYIESDRLDLDHLSERREPTG